MMVAGAPDWIRATLSQPRFQPYLTACDHDLAAAIRLYWWNVEVSEAFYAPLHCLELALRNAIHHCLRAHFSRNDWWVGVHLADAGQRSVSMASQKIVTRDGRPITPDDVVAQLPFGFWVSLLSRGRRYDRTLWVPALHRAFPHYRGPRQPLHDNFYAILRLRNRVMHHERIDHRDLRADHAKIYRLLGYISPDLVKQLKRIDRVPEVLQRRRSGQLPGDGVDVTR